MRSFFEYIFQLFCRLVVRLLYQRMEVLGSDRIPSKGPVLLCVNHGNSLADGVVVQAALNRTLRPVARKRLFDLPFTGHILNLIKAVPVYSREYGDEGGNNDGFERLYQLVEEGELIVIFPEGQSHNAPRLFPIKTGAARMTLGSLQRLGHAPQVIPVGLIYTDQRKFRRSVLVQIGKPIDIDHLPEGEPAQVAALTERLQEQMAQLTINAGSWEELELSMRIARFFELRKAKPRLHHRFKALKVILENQHRLQNQYPKELREIEAKLDVFEQLTKLYGIDDYQLDIRYTPWVVLRFMAIAIGFICVVLPMVLWGLLNSLLPWLGIVLGFRWIAVKEDQIDTARILGALFMATVFWSAQTYWVSMNFDGDWALRYLLSLPLCVGLMLLMREYRQRIVSNARVFFTFMRKRSLKQNLLALRTSIEHDLAELVRLAKLPVEFYNNDKL